MSSKEELLVFKAYQLKPHYDCTAGVSVNILIDFISRELRGYSMGVQTSPNIPPTASQVAVTAN